MRPRLDLPTIIKLFSPANDQLRSLQDKNIVLFVGRTGAGKSATVNYLGGRQFELVEDPKSDQEILQIVTGQTLLAAIGDDFDSKTFYPQAIPRSSPDFVFCDCPGFFDSRTHEENLCTILTTQLAIKLARNVTAVVICIPREDLLPANKGANLRLLVDRINSIFQNFGSIAPKVLFAITKGNKKLQKSHIRNNIDDLKASISRLLADAKAMEHQKIKSAMSGSGDSLTPEEIVKLFLETQTDDSHSSLRSQVDMYHDQLSILNRIGDDNIILIDPTDGGDSRQEMFKTLARVYLITLKDSKSTDIPKAQFKLPQTDTLHVAFRELVLETAHKGKEDLRNHQNLIDSGQSRESLLAQKRQELQEQKARQVELSQNRSQKERLAIYLSGEKARLQGLNLEIKVAESRHSNLAEEQKRLEAYLATIDSDAPDNKPYWAESQTFEKDKWIIALTALAGMAVLTAAITAIVVTAGGAAVATGAAAGGAVTAAAAEGGATAAVAAGAGAATGVTVGLGTGAAAGVAVTRAALSITAAAGLGVKSWNWLVRNLRRYEFQYSDLPFLFPQLLANRGSFIWERSAPEEGTYKVWYIPNPYFRSTGSVEIFIAKRNVPEYQREIKTTKERLAVIQLELVALKTQLLAQALVKKDCEKQVTELQTQISRIDAAMREGPVSPASPQESDTSLLARFEATIKATEQQVQDLQEELVKNQQARTALAAEIVKQSKQLDFAYEIYHLDPVSYTALQPFCTLYQASGFKQEKSRDTEQKALPAHMRKDGSLFSGSSASSSSSSSSSSLPPDSAAASSSASSGGLFSGSHASSSSSSSSSSSLPSGSHASSSSSASSSRPGAK